MNFKKAVSIYETEGKDHLVAGCQFSKKEEVVPNAVRQYTFIPTEKELELLNGSKYKQAISDILNMTNNAGNI